MIDYNNQPIQYPQTMMVIPESAPDEDLALYGMPSEEVFDDQDKSGVGGDPFIMELYGMPPEEVFDDKDYSGGDEEDTIMVALYGMPTDIENQPDVTDVSDNAVKNGVIAGSVAGLVALATYVESLKKKRKDGGDK